MTVSDRPQAALRSQDGPRVGGTLRLRGPAPVHRLDPSASHQAPADQVIRLFARQLFGYAPAPDLRDWRAIAPAPDLATDVPSTYNTGMGARHTNYVVHLRRGVFWDTEPAREVTAHDVVRGLKRLANPLTRPAALPYFTSTIRGMAQYCEDYAAAIRRDDPTAEELAAFQNSHDIPGVLVLDDESLVIELVRPAIDFAAIMALPCASPAPVEYDAFLPGSPELHRNLRSNGPYRPVRLVPGRELRLEPNPVWRQESDPLRHRYLDGIEVAVEDAAPEHVAARVASGAADLPWGVRVAEPHGAEPADPGDGLGLSLDPYLVFNLRSPAAGGALADVRVRRALSYAIDKAAIADLYRRSGRGALVRTAGSVVPPGNDAHQELDLYATPGSRGDASRCRALLAEAGHGSGLRSPRSISTPAWTPRSRARTRPTWRRRASPSGSWRSTTTPATLSSGIRAGRRRASGTSRPRRGRRTGTRPTAGSSSSRCSSRATPATPRTAAATAVRRSTASSSGRSPRSRSRRGRPRRGTRPSGRCWRTPRSCPCCSSGRPSRACAARGFGARSRCPRSAMPTTSPASGSTRRTTRRTTPRSDGGGPNGGDQGARNA